MTDSQILMICFIVAFPLLAYAKRLKILTLSSFALDSRQYGWFVIAAGISMTFAGGAATVNMASLGYQFGWYPFLDPLSVVFAVVLVAVFFAPAIRTARGITIADALADVNGHLGLFLGIVTFFAYILITAAQVVALGKMLKPFFAVSDFFLIVVPSLSIFLYVFIGGLRSVTYTDIIQYILVFSFVVAPLLFAIFGDNALESIDSVAISPNVMPLNLIIFMVFPLLFVPASQDLNIRIRAARNLTSARLGMVAGGVSYFLIVGSSILIGIQLARTGIGLARIFH